MKRCGKRTGLTRTTATAGAAGLSALRTSLSDGVRDLTRRALGVISPEYRVDYRDSDRAVHRDLKRTIGRYSADGYGRHFHHSRQSLEPVDANRAARIGLGIGAKYGT